MSSIYEYGRVYVYNNPADELEAAGITTMYNVYVRTCFGGHVGLVAKRGRKWIVSRVDSKRMRDLVNDLTSEHKQPFNTRWEAAHYLDGQSMNDAIRMKTLPAS